MIRRYLLDEVLPRYKFNEYFICSTDELVDEFRRRLIGKENERVSDRVVLDEQLLRLEHGNYQRMKTTVNLELAEKIYLDDSVDRACQRLRDRLDHLNGLVSRTVQDNLTAAIDNCLASCRYYFFADDGPKYERVSHPETPFIGKYFLYPNDEYFPGERVVQLIEEDDLFQLRTMAHNGWVMNDDPLKSFADAG